jgi:hypothetical protein
LCKPKNLVPAKWNKAEQKEQSLHASSASSSSSSGTITKKGSENLGKKEPQPFGWGLVITCYLLTSVNTFSSAAFTATKIEIGAFGFAAFVYQIGYRFLDSVFIGLPALVRL